jgi:hypothetical protein
MLEQKMRDGGGRNALRCNKQMAQAGGAVRSAWWTTTKGTRLSHCRLRRQYIISAFEEKVWWEVKDKAEELGDEVT